MLISKTLRPLLSNKAYKSDARRKMQEYNLDTCMFINFDIFIVLSF